jgi:O-antigen/teichoic acid export membrane protein
MDQKSKQKAVKGVAWTSAANWGCQLLGFCFSTTLARLLNPQAYGLVALAWVYIAFIQIFVTQGFGMAIIQRRDLEEEHLDSAFWIAVTTALVFCFLSILLAGRIAHFFKEPRIAPVIEWLCFTMLFSALSSMPTAILTRDLNFRPLAVRSLVATGLSGAVGVTMAFLGWGVWSLVGQQLVAAVLSCACLWFAVPWRPRLVVSKRHLRDLYGFSLSLTGNDILWFFSQKSDQTIVGYGFGAAGLGPYSLAAKLPTLAYDALVAPFQGVAFPAFSELQSAPMEFESALHKFCEISSFLCLPMFTGLAVTAPELVPLLFGPKWAAAVPILQVLALYGALRVVLAFMHPFMLAKGRAGLYLLMGLVLSGLTVLGCLAALRWGPNAVAFSMVASMFVFFGIFLEVARKYLQVRTVPLLKSFAFPVLCSLAMFAVVSALTGILAKDIASPIMLAISVFAGIAFYVTTANLLRPDLVKKILTMARGSLPTYKTRVSTGLTQAESAVAEVSVRSDEVETEVLQ